MVDRVGLQLGNYRLVQMIGQGGFSDVYLGEHIYLNTKAAIKLLQVRLLGSNMEQFRNEARTIASLVYPHIVRVLDFGVEDNIPYLVMDYAPNGTLRQLHPRGTALALQNIVPYVKQIALALQYAHDRKLIHRDIKPENMLLGSNNEVLLSDFGLVLVAQSSGSDMTQEMVGTVPYMAPEQLRGKPRAASDQYALGVVVYEWLSGERPFNGSFVEIASQHILAPPPPLYGRIPGISPTLEQVVFTALDKDPRQRFASVQAFASTLEQVCLPVRPVQFISPNPNMLVPGSESSLPTYVKPLPSESSQPTYMVTPQDQISQPGFNKPQPGIPLQPTSMVTPPGPAAQAAMNTPLPSQSSQPTYMATPSNQPVLLVTMTTQASQPTVPDQATPALQPGALGKGPGGVSPRPRRRALTWLLAAMISLVLVATIFSAILFGIRPLFLHSNNNGAGSGLHSPAVSSSPLATAIVKHASTPTPSPTQAASPPLPQPSPSSLDPTACQSGSTGWTCSVKLSLPSSAPTYINWRTNTSNNLSGVAFSPSSNKLTPGQTQSVSIFVPYDDCFPGSFYFIGINTTTVSWNCTTSPNPSPSPTPSPSPSPSPMQSPSPTPSPSPSLTPSPSPSPTPSPSPSSMPSTSPTPSVTG